MSGAIKTLAPYVKVITTDATRLRRRTATDSTVVEDIFISVDSAVVGKRCSALFSLLRFRRVMECLHSPGGIAVDVWQGISEGGPNGGPLLSFNVPAPKEGPNGGKEFSLGHGGPNSRQSKFPIKESECDPEDILDLRTRVTILNSIQAESGSQCRPQLVDHRAVRRPRRAAAADNLWAPPPP